MNSKKNDLTPLVLKYGAILGALLIGYTVVLHALHQTMNPTLGYVNYLLILFVIYFAIKDARDNKNDGYIEFGQGVKIGFLISLFAGTIISAFTVVLYKFIDPSIIEEAISKAMDEAVKRGTAEIGLDAIEKATRMMLSPIPLFFISLLSIVLIGVLISLVLASILKKKKDPFAEAMQEVK